MIFIILGFPQVGEFSNISLPGTLLPFTSYNGYLVFSIICYFTESTTVIGAIVGFLVNPLNNKKNQGACMSSEIFLVWLSAGNVSKSCPRAIIVMLTKALEHMQKYRLWSVLGLYLWRNVTAGLEEESCGDVKCMSFMDDCSDVQSVKNFGVENPIRYFLPAKIFFQPKYFSCFDEDCLSN